jgi:ubiquinone biosynthesis protein
MIRKIGVIGTTYRHIKRYQKIISVLVKYGFGYLVDATNLHKIIDLGKKFIPGEKDDRVDSLSIWERIRMVLEELGPSFVKLGQIMSNRPDLIPHKLIVELEKLQDSVPPFSREEAKKLVEDELSKPLNMIFLEFTEKPVASASIAQVHKAVLLSGEKVAVKVQRPKIEQIIEVDLEIMLHLAALMEKHIEGMDVFNPVGIVEEFERTINEEIDFTIEASHIERFGKHFQSDMTVYVPKVYRSYTTKKVLVMEAIDGVKVSNTEKILESGFDPKIISERGAQFMLKQIFKYGFFHADPHPGNIFILPENVICFLDYGMVGVVSERLKEQLRDIIIGIANKDAKRITKALLKMAEHENGINVDKLENQISVLVQKYGYLPLKDINMGDLLEESAKLLLAYELKMPSDFYLLVKALITIEGVGRNLDPDFNLIEHAKEYAEMLMKERLSVRQLAKDFYLSTADFIALLRDFPSGAQDIIELIKKGDMRFSLEHKGLESMLTNLNQISNRVVFAIVLAALIIGSSLIVLSGLPPTWRDIPIIGIVGFLGAGIMAFWLLVSIVRHGKM